MKVTRMLISLFGLLAIVATLWLALPAAAGGWVVVTLEHLPTQVRAGEPVALVVIVRQHGQDPIHVQGQVVATRQGSVETVRFAAQPMIAEGYHRVEVTFPTAGTWNWHFDPSPFPPNGEFAPLTVLPAEASRYGWWEWLWALLAGRKMVSAAQSSEADYGRALFLAKGCASCHVHSQARLEWSTELGKNLTDYAPNADFVRLWLRDAWNLTANQQWRMPTLELTDAEMNALIAFLAE